MDDTPPEVATPVAAAPEKIAAVLPGIPVTAGSIIVTPAPPATVPAPQVGQQEDRLPSKTTPEQDRTTASQRETSLMWETTQMRIALSVVWASLTAAMVLAIFGKWLGGADVQLAAVVFVFGVANLVVGFYFGRTNHTKVGGVGDKSERER